MQYIYVSCRMPVYGYVRIRAKRSCVRRRPSKHTGTGCGRFRVHAYRSAMIDDVLRSDAVRTGGAPPEAAS
jgi:hypothetical protein